MKVFIVERDCGPEGAFFEGAFSTNPLAAAHADKLSERAYVSEIELDALARDSGSTGDDT